MRHRRRKPRRREADQAGLAFAVPEFFPLGDGWVAGPAPHISRKFSLTEVRVLRVSSKHNPGPEGSGPGRDSIGSGSRRPKS
jgi:hypothetical protein